VTLDADLVRARCGEIADSVTRLERIRDLPLDQFPADRDTQDIACYRLLVAIEAALALCYHVSARRLREAPEDYASCFTALERTSVIPADLADRLRRMARFRNLLVHVYWRIAYEQVYEILQHQLGDLSEFSRRVAQLV
jgi:uncharacterized protein YutE (UPF0331/DUF86 family)